MGRTRLPFAPQQATVRLLWDLLWGHRHDPQAAGGRAAQQRSGMPTVAGFEVASGACLDLSDVSTEYKVRDRATRRLSMRLSSQHSASSSLACGMLCEPQALAGLVGIALMTMPWVVFTCWYCNRLSLDTVRGRRCPCVPRAQQSLPNRALSIPTERA